MSVQKQEKCVIQTARRYKNRETIPAAGKPLPLQQNEAQPCAER